VPPPQWSPPEAIAAIGLEPVPTEYASRDVLELERLALDSPLSCQRSLVGCKRLQVQYGSFAGGCQVRLRYISVGPLIPCLPTGGDVQGDGCGRLRWACLQGCGEGTLQTTNLHWFLWPVPTFVTSASAVTARN
jgi:hypothetical protein